MTLAPLAIASSACEIWVASEPSALFAMTCADGSSWATALTKSGLSWPSNRAAHVEHGIRNAIFPPAAALLALLGAPLPLLEAGEAAPVEEPPLPHPASASASTAADAPTIACILFIEHSWVI